MSFPLNSLVVQNGLLRLPTVDRQVEVVEHVADGEIRMRLPNTLIKLAIAPFYKCRSR